MMPILAPVFYSTYGNKRADTFELMTATTRICVAPWVMLTMRGRGASKTARVILANGREVVLNHRCTYGCGPHTLPRAQIGLRGYALID